MNLTTGKQVTASANAGTAILAVDGVAEKDEHWSAMPGPGSLTVDLERAVRLGELRLYTWWGDDRHYQYTIEVSADGKNWQKLVNASGNTEKTSPQGYRHTIPPTRARYIRVDLLKNSANPAVHLCELRAYEAK